MILKFLKPLLNSIIYPKNTEFVEGHQILYGIVTAHEVIHSLNKSKKLGILIKLELSKDYDRLSQVYLLSVLYVFGFFPEWVSWIKSMISSPFYSILLNGLPTMNFNPSRGLCQGNPISPFLFILAVEGLGRYLKENGQWDI